MRWIPSASLRATRYINHCEDYYVSREMQLAFPDEEYIEYQGKMAAENEGAKPDLDNRSR
jgi:hypothetical protein